MNNEQVVCACLPLALKRAAFLRSHTKAITATRPLSGMMNHTPCADLMHLHFLTVFWTPTLLFSNAMVQNSGVAHTVCTDHRSVCSLLNGSQVFVDAKLQ